MYAIDANPDIGYSENNEDSGILARSLNVKQDLDCGNDFLQIIPPQGKGGLKDGWKKRSVIQIRTITFLFPVS